VRQFIQKNVLRPLISKYYDRRWSGLQNLVYWNCYQQKFTCKITIMRNKSQKSTLKQGECLYSSPLFWKYVFALDHTSVNSVARSSETW